jgi:hypothetical protein
VDLAECCHQANGDVQEAQVERLPLAPIKGADPEARRQGPRVRGSSVPRDE